MPLYRVDRVAADDWLENSLTLQGEGTRGRKNLE